MNASITPIGRPTASRCPTTSPQRSATRWSIGRRRSSKRNVSSSRSLIEPPASSAVGQPLDAVPKLRRRDHAQEHAIFVDLGEPGDNSRVRPSLHPFGYDARIEQQAHKSAFRGRSFRRPMSIPEFRRGEPVKNSARLRVRFDFSSHSSAETTTTTDQPRLVMVCGPLTRASRSARSTATLLRRRSSFWCS